MPKSNRVLLAALVMSVCAMLALRGHADDAAPAPAKLAVVGRVAVAPAAQIQAVADDLGITMPAILTPGGVEQMFIFLGAGGFNKDLPTAIDFLAGDGNLKQAQRAIFYLPVNAGHAPIKDFLISGEKMGDDGAIVGGSPFRRTDDYLLFGGTPESIGAIKPDEMVKDLADHPLLYMEYDAKKLREAEPSLLALWKKNSMEAGGQPQTKAEAAGQQLALDAIVDDLNKLVIRLDKKPDALRLTTQIEPSPSVDVKNWTVPAMPDGLAARMDFQMPDGWCASLVQWAKKATGEEEFYPKDAGIDTPEKKQKFVTAVSDFLENILCGDETSYGVGLNDGDWIIYIITQTNAPRGGHQDWQRITDGMKPFTGQNGKADQMTLSQFNTAGGEQADRLICDGDDGKPEAVIESVDHGNVRCTTMTHLKNNAIDKLLAGKGSVTLSTAASGWVDLQALVAMTSKLNPKSALTDADHQLLDKVLGGGRIDWTVSTDGGRFNLMIDLPVTLVKSVVSNASELAEMTGRIANKEQDK